MHAVINNMMLPNKDKMWETSETLAPDMEPPTNKVAAVNITGDQRINTRTAE